MYDSTPAPKLVTSLVRPLAAALLLAATQQAVSAQTFQFHGERNVGPWSFEPTPTPSGGTHILYDVEGRSANDVWAVGYQSAAAGGTPRTLTLHWDGATWSHVPSPNSGTGWNDLDGVAVLPDGRALAVGSSGSTAQTLAMVWDGAGWELVGSPSAPSGSVFSDAHTAPNGEVWVSGFSFGIAQIHRWNGGSSWDSQVAPKVGSYRNRFYGLSAVSPSEIYCAGTEGNGPGDFEILLQRYDGGDQWTTFHEVTPGWMDSLYGIAAVASDDVWAAGAWYSPFVSSTQPLLMHWDGSDWQQWPLADFLEGPAELRSITAVSSNEVYAAGTYARPDGTPRPLVLKWNGEKWGQVALPASGGSHEWFRGMGATPDGEVWAVGQYYDGALTAPLTFVRS